MSQEGHTHDLASEFPELKEKIHELKMNSAHFRTLFERYQEVDRAVARTEARIDLMSHEEEEKLRHERVRLKDELYTLLTAQDS